MAEESIRLINELKAKVALAKQNEEKDKLKSETEEYFKKLLEDKEAEIWKKVEGQKLPAKKFEYDEDEMNQVVEEFYPPTTDAEENAVDSSSVVSKLQNDLKPAQSASR